MRRLLNNIIALVGIILMSGIFTSCHDKEDEARLERTVLVYMVANNNLGHASYDEDDLREMRLAISNGALDKGGRLFVYRNSYGGKSTLMELTRKGDILIEENDETLEGASLNPEKISSMIERVKVLGGNAPMGLVLWSHGTGWMDDNPSNGAHYSFGLDHRTRLDLPNLERALRGHDLDWIYFDCCHMATVEVFYELRDCARYLVGSTTELPVAGMRYDLNIPLFFAPGEADLVGAARNTYEYYNSKTSVYDRFCTMSVVDCDKLNALAEATRHVMEEATQGDDSYEPVPYMRGVSTIFDMPHYIRSLGASASTVNIWEKAYTDAVIYSAATPMCLNLDLSQYTGLGCHILDSQDFKSLYGYDRTQWWSDVVSHNALFRLIINIQ